MMSGHGKSDSLIVPRKPPNKAQATEAVEGRRLAKGNLLEQNILRTQSRVGMHRTLERVREANCYSLANKGSHGISRFPFEVFPCVPGVCDRAGSVRLSPYRCAPCCLLLTSTVSAPWNQEPFHGSMAGPHVPLSTLRSGPCGPQRMTRGRCGSLHLHRMTLSFTTPRRFSSALSDVGSNTT